MNVLFGILFIVGGVSYLLYVCHVTARKASIERQLQTTRLEDAGEILDSLADAGLHCRHYVELKGVVGCDALVTAPFSDRPVAYYEDRAYSVWADRTHSSDPRTPSQVERELFQERSRSPIFITDESRSKIYIDTQSLSGSMELTPSCDRFEAKDSIWMNRNRGRLPRTVEDGEASPDFLGYRLKETILLPGQSLYILGELYRMEGKLFVGMATLSKKASFVSCKSGTHLITDLRKQRATAIVIGGILALIGLVLLLIR